MHEQSLPACKGAGLLMTAHMGSTRKEKVYWGMYLGTWVWYDITMGMLSSFANRSAPKHCATTPGSAEDRAARGGQHTPRAIRLR
jgi:hypothetical protein